MPSVRCENLVKRFKDVVAVDDVTFEAKEGTFYTLLGPSGCGKSTTLRMIAGLETPDSGNIYIGDELVTSTDKGYFVPPERRNLGMVFQSYAVWPHMKVFDNIAFPLKIRKLPKSEVKARVKEVLALIGLEGCEDKYPHQLSGGEQQRVALARALVYEPKVLLLDEPLSNLDAKVRERMRFELKDLQRRLGVTTIYVTHDQEEAMVLSDIMAVMNKGKIVQEGTPLQLYREPKCEFVASFIGLTNFIEGKVIKIPEGDELGLVDTACGELRCPIPKDVREGDGVLISIRPENIALSEKRPEGDVNTWEGKVKARVFLGKDMDYRILVGDQRIRVITPSSLIIDEGRSVFLRLDPERCVIIKK
jgi:iron(III) transport system ATP-binding protein